MHAAAPRLRGDEKEWWAPQKPAHIEAENRYDSITGRFRHSRGRGPNKPSLSNNNRFE